MTDFEQQASIDPAETFQVILYAIITASISELGTWYMIYRKHEYKTLKGNIDNLAAKIKKTKDTQVAPDQKKGQDKKLQQLEAQLKAYNNQMSTFRMKSTFLIAIFMIITVSSFGTIFQGIVVAKLPFTPISFLTNLTHRGLMGDDYTDCSYLFLYVTSAYIWRTNVQKIFGFEPPRSHNNPWAMAPPPSVEEKSK